MPSVPTLLAVPNVSEGRDAGLIAALADAFTAPGVCLLDVHSDADHHRSVFTLAGPPVALGDALLRGFRVAVESVNVMTREPGQQAGQHPHVGAVDVAPLVYLSEADAGAACAHALVVADRVGEELGVPVLIYGRLSAQEEAAERTRAQLRRGGAQVLARRLAGEDPDSLTPDFGPRHVHPTAGATLVAARPPLVAFNVQLAAPAGVQRARELAALIREGGPEGLPGVRAIGVELSGGVGQVSMNVERPLELPLALVVAAIEAHARLQSAELVGLAPAAALEGFPADLPMPGFDPGRQVIEHALGDPGAEHPTGQPII